MRLEVAVMSPLYQINLGYIARVMSNFGLERLYLINPRCNHLGKQALQYSKHARPLLERATICKSIADLGGNALVLGSTGIWRKGGSALHNVYSLEGASRFVKRNIGAGKRVVVLLGRDDLGLGKEELRECDATLFIETDKRYPILNISHALAIMLHAFLKETQSGEYAFMKDFYADPKYQSRLARVFSEFIKGSSRIKDKSTVAMAFRHVLARAAPTRKEINTLAVAFSGKRGDSD